MLAEFGTGQVLWSMLWFALFFFWVWTVVIIFADVIRSEDLSGWGKALWSVFIIFAPFLGILMYLIVRGRSMHERAVRDARDREAELREYVQTTVHGSSTADEIAKLAEMRAQGALTDTEFQLAKSKALM